MLSVVIDEICKVYALGTALEKPQKIPGGLLHNIWQLQTSKGLYAIKQIAADNLVLLNHHLLSQQKSEKIAAIMQENGIATVTALHVAGNVLFSFEEDKFLIMPWVKGVKYLGDNVTPLRSQEIGKTLAQIHLVNFTDPEVPVVNFKGLQHDEWHNLIQRIPHRNLKEFLNSKLKKLISWSEQVNQANLLATPDYVFSHRDLDDKNVLWQDFTPVLLDWEYAGWINPALDLLIVACNWGGVQYGFLSKENFQAIILGFAKLKNPKPLSPEIFHLYFGYCLDWLIFNIQKFIKNPSENYHHEIVGTLTAIEIVERHQGDIAAWWGDFVFR